MALNENIDLKVKFLAHIETCRPYTVIWSGLVSLVGASIVFHDLPPLDKSILIFIIPILGWIAGLYASDYIDRRLDEIEKSHRPLPSGRLTPKGVIVSAFFFAGIGFIFSIFLGLIQVIMVFIVAIFVLSYAKISKAKGLIGNINRGLLIVLAFLFGVFTARDIDFSPTLVAIGLLFFIHDVNSNLIGAARDVYGDKKRGYHTFPVKYGIKKSIFLSIILTSIWMCIGITVVFSPIILFPDRYLTLFLSGVILIYLGYWHIWKTNMERMNLLKMHSFFVVERIILASSFFFGIISSEYALFIFITTLSVTIISQQFLRKRYEFP
ncbi:MAG: hypothetical protein DRN12_07945 [Thermoplasmata archaeon]|nr:MAG: hypothetical protein DRN12_07945 [Thermoplasmata archaeon]